MPLITIRVSPSESAHIVRLARARGLSRSALILQAVLEFEERAEPSVLDAFGDAVGMVRNAPHDLATNPRHLKGYGR